MSRGSQRWAWVAASSLAGCSLVAGLNDFSVAPGGTGGAGAVGGTGGHTTSSSGGTSSGGGGTSSGGGGTSSGGGGTGGGAAAGGTAGSGGAPCVNCVWHCQNGCTNPQALGDCCIDAGCTNCVDRTSECQSLDGTPCATAQAQQDFTSGTPFVDPGCSAAPNSQLCLYWRCTCS